jgi:nucleotide-binding universal stress UspA family protein
MKPDLVVAGRKGQGAVSRAIFGSVSSRLVESDMRPLLVIPENAEINEMKEALFLSDFYDSDIANLKTLASFLKPRNARINVMHYHTSEHEKDVDEEFFKHFEGVVRDRVGYDNFSFKMEDSNDLHDSLDEVIKSKKIQMLCIASMHRSFWQQLVDPSLTKHLLKKIDLPVLIFDAHAENVEDLF